MKGKWEFTSQSGKRKARQAHSVAQAVTQLHRDVDITRDDETANPAFFRKIWLVLFLKT